MINDSMHSKAAQNDSATETAKTEQCLFSKRYSLKASDRKGFRESGDHLEKIVLINQDRTIGIKNDYDDGRIRVQVKFEKIPDYEFTEITVSILDASILPVHVEGIDCEYTVGNGSGFDGTYDKFSDIISMNESGIIQRKRVKQPR